MGAVLVVALRSDTNGVLEGRVKERHFKKGWFSADEGEREVGSWGNPSKLYTLPLPIAPLGEPRLPVISLGTEFNATADAK